MAARTRRIFNDANTRAKIQTTQIVHRLQKHIDGDIELSSTQVRAAEILLNKSLPNLTSAQIDAGETLQTVLVEMLGRDKA